MVGLHFYSSGKLGFISPYHLLRTKMCLRWAAAIVVHSLFFIAHEAADLGYGIWYPTCASSRAFPAGQQSCGGLQELSCLPQWANAPEREELKAGIQVRKLLVTEKNDRGRRYSCPCFWQCFSPGNKFLSPTCEWKISCVSKYFFLEFDCWEVKKLMRNIKLTFVD